MSPDPDDKPAPKAAAAEPPPLPAAPDAPPALTTLDAVIAPPMDPPPVTALVPVPQYEFNAEQNQIIGGLASAMKWVAIFSTVLGVLNAVATFQHLFKAFSNAGEWFTVGFLGLISALFVGLGMWLGTAAEAFRLIVVTTGRDITLLMTALEEMRKTFTVASGIIQAYIALLVIMLSIALLGLLAGALG